MSKRRSKSLFARYSDLLKRKQIEFLQDELFLRNNGANTSFSFVVNPLEVKVSIIQKDWRLYLIDTLEELDEEKKYFWPSPLLDYINSDPFPNETRWKDSLFHHSFAHNFHNNLHSLPSD